VKFYTINNLFIMDKRLRTLGETVPNLQRDGRNFLTWKEKLGLDLQARYGYIFFYIKYFY
jgi:hypothetical protein